MYSLCQFYYILCSLFTLVLCAVQPPKIYWMFMGPIVEQNIFCNAINLWKWLSDRVNKFMNFCFQFQTWKPEVRFWSLRFVLIRLIINLKTNHFLFTTHFFCITNLIRFLWTSVLCFSYVEFWLSSDSNSEAFMCVCV